MQFRRWYRRLIAFPRTWLRRRRARRVQSSFAPTLRRVGFLQRIGARVLDWCRDGETERAVRGRTAEAFAARQLRGKGLTILQRNWRGLDDARDEIDLIAVDCGTTVFVEVRARQVGALVHGVQTLTARKRKALKRAIDAYRRDEHAGPWRVDVVDVRLNSDRIVEWAHYENVQLKKVPRRYRTVR